MAVTLNPTALEQQQVRRLKDLCDNSNDVLSFDDVMGGASISSAGQRLLVGFARAEKLDIARLLPGIDVAAFPSTAATSTTPGAAGAANATGAGSPLTQGGGAQGSTGATPTGGAPNGSTPPTDRVVMAWTEDDQRSFIGTLSKGHSIFIQMSIHGELRDEMRAVVREIALNRTTAFIDVELPSGGRIVKHAIRLPMVKQGDIDIVNMRLATEDLATLTAILLSAPRARIDPFEPHTWEPFLKTEDGRLKWEDELSRQLELPLRPGDAPPTGRFSHQQELVTGLVEDSRAMALSWIENGAPLPPAWLRFTKRVLDRAVELQLTEQGYDPAAFTQAMAEGQGRRQAVMTAREKGKKK